MNTNDLVKMSVVELVETGVSIVDVVRMRRELKEKVEKGYDGSLIVVGEKWSYKGEMMVDVVVVKGYENGKVTHLSENPNHRFWGVEEVDEEVFRWTYGKM